MFGICVQTLNEKKKTECQQAKKKQFKSNKMKSLMRQLYKNKMNKSHKDEKQDLTEHQGPMIQMV